MPTAETQITRAIRLHVQRRDGHSCSFDGGPDVSIGSDPDCDLHLDHISVPSRAAMLRLNGYYSAELRPLAPGVTDRLGYDIIRGYVSAGDVFVVGPYTITVVEICDASPAQEI